MNRCGAGGKSEQRGKKLGVIPANAGIHNHSNPCSGTRVAPISCHHIVLWLWVPGRRLHGACAPFRLARDDIEDEATCSHLTLLEESEAHLGSASLHPTARYCPDGVRRPCQASRTWW